MHLRRGRTEEVRAHRDSQHLADFEGSYAERISLSQPSIYRLLFWGRGGGGVGNLGCFGDGGGGCLQGKNEQAVTIQAWLHLEPCVHKEPALGSSPRLNKPRLRRFTGYKGCSRQSCTCRCLGILEMLGLRSIQKKAETCITQFQASGLGMCKKQNQWVIKRAPPCLEHGCPAVPPSSAQERVPHCDKCPLSKSKQCPRMSRTWSPLSQALSKRLLDGKQGISRT